MKRTKQSHYPRKGLKFPEVTCNAILIVYIKSHSNKNALDPLYQQCHGGTKVRQQNPWTWRRRANSSNVLTGYCVCPWQFVVSGSQIVFHPKTGPKAQGWPERGGGALHWCLKLLSESWLLKQCLKARFCPMHLKFWVLWNRILFISFIHLSFNKYLLKI